MTALLIAEDSSRSEIAEALGHLCERARRVPHVFGVTAPSDWDAAHQAIDLVLTDWQRAEEKDVD